MDKNRYVGCFHFGRGTHFISPKTRMPGNLLNYFLTLIKLGFRPFHDTKGPVMPSIGIRPSSDHNGYS